MIIIRIAGLLASLLIVRSGSDPHERSYLTDAAPDSAGAPIVIDGFESVAGWKAMPSDPIKLSIAQDTGLHGRSMRLDFDFGDRGGGYAIARKNFDIPLPGNYAFTFAIRGDAPINTLEFKLIDSSGDNVWWSNQRNFVFPREWKTVTRKKRHLGFAWGPIGGGDLKRVAAIEFVITAGTGGKGTVWIDDLKLTPLDPEAPPRPPRLSASSSASGHPVSLAMDGSQTTSWRTAPSSAGQSLDIDFLDLREFGGMVINWEPARRPSAYTVAASTNRISWDTLYTVERGAGSKDNLFFPESEFRYLRILLPSGATAGIREIKIQPVAWSATKTDFFTAIAREASPGSYPKYFSGEQSFWTVLGVDGDTREGLVNEQGMIETGRSEFSIEPFLFTGGRLTTWRDAVTAVGSVDGDLPIKTVSWRIPGLSMDITTFAAGTPESSLVYARYRLRNPSAARRRVTLYLAVRPFQANPPWQFLNAPGGVATIDSIAYDGRVVNVNAGRRIIPLQAPSAFGAMSFDEGNIVDLLRRNRVPSSRTIRDRFGHASGVLAYDLDLAPRGESTVDVAIPLHRSGLPPAVQTSAAGRANPWVTQQLERTTADWQRKLSLVQIELPPSAARITETLRANLAYILINRDGPSLQPGSRSYERSWIRDGSLTSTALLRLGHYPEVRDFITWYAKFQFENGKIPCCVDFRGADPIPENDSHGEFIYLVAEYYRHTGDRALLEQVWPNVSRAWTFMDSLRRSRMTPEFQQGNKRVFYGLLPQSISHEGYSAKPMHSYWDDFFALRGFKDITEIARILSKPDTSRYAAVRDEFRRDFYASIKLSMAQHRIDYIPGAAELGDFDATSTTVGISPAEELARLPQPALQRTFDKYHENLVARRDGKVKWNEYVPYELRVVGTYVRLGQKARAHETLDFLFLGQHPREWHQWAEIVYRDPKSPKWIGDMPHTWVGSDYIRSILDMFAYERESDSSIVIGAGVLDSWVREGTGLRVRDLSTHYGRLGYSMRAAGDAVEIRIGGPRIPPGGLIIRSPFNRPIRSATLDGRRIASTGSEVVIRTLPASLVLRY